MTDRKLIGIVTALLFLTSPQGARAEVTLEHLLAIDRFLSNNDMQALYSYLQRNPELLTGDDELSNELRSFHSSASSGDLDFNYASDPPPPAEDIPVESTALANSLQH